MFPKKPLVRTNNILFYLLMIIIFTIWSRYDFNNRNSFEMTMNKVNIQDDILVHIKDPKYILIWTVPHDLKKLGKGRKKFIKKKCAVTNCYITTNKLHFNSLSKFDVILFHGPEIIQNKSYEMPNIRSMKQKYVFSSVDSSDLYPLCHNNLNGFFNTTWTYKLDSDINRGYVVVKNKEGDIIGPKTEMHWMNIIDMKPINDTVKLKLKSKRKLAAWFVSNCYKSIGWQSFVKKIREYLKEINNYWTVDVYGDCGTYRCGSKEIQRCLQMFEDEYYFYFSFEDYFSEDYVTDKILHALQHYTVPVVYGGANYTRFMPDGTYIDAMELGAEQLAIKMVELVNDKEQYYQYFKWVNHYSFHYTYESPETLSICKFCAAINDEEFMNKTSVIGNLKHWWNPTSIRPEVCLSFKLQNDKALFFGDYFK